MPNGQKRQQRKGYNNSGIKLKQIIQIHFTANKNAENEPISERNRTSKTKNNGTVIRDEKRESLKDK